MFNSIAPIAKALGWGYGPSTVIKMLSKKFPALAPFVNKATTAGFLAPSILKALIGESGEATTPHGRRRHKEKKRDINGALALAGTVGGLGYGASKLLAKGAGAVAQGAQAAQIPPPGGGGGPPGGIAGPAAVGQAPQPPKPSPFAGARQMAEKLPPISSEKDVASLPLEIKKEAAAGKSTEEIYEGLKKSPKYSPIVQQQEHETGTPFTERIKFFTGNKSSGAIPAKSDVVITPFGSGEVHKTHGDNAYVEVNNKLKKVPLNEVETPPEDYVDTVNNILKIPEVDRSSNVALFVYDPEESKAFFQFHDGSFYKYFDMDPEVVRKIADKEATPITQGENMYGAWSPDDPHGSIGAALWAYVLKDPKYAKSRKDQPANPNYKKLETLYDYWEKLRKIKKR